MQSPGCGVCRCRVSGEQLRNSGEEPPFVVAVVTEEVAPAIDDFQSVVIVESEVEVSVQTVLVLVDRRNEAIELHIREVVSGPGVRSRWGVESSEVGCRVVQD